MNMVIISAAALIIMVGMYLGRARFRGWLEKPVTTKLLGELSAANIRQRSGRRGLFWGLLAAIVLSYGALSLINTLLLLSLDKTWAPTSEPYPEEVRIGASSYGFILMRENATQTLVMVERSAPLRVVKLDKAGDGQSVLHTSEEHKLNVGDLVAVNQPGSRKKGRIARIVGPSSFTLEKPGNHAPGPLEEIETLRVDVEKAVLQLRVVSEGGPFSFKMTVRIVPTDTLKPVKAWVEKHNLASTADLVTLRWWFGPAILDLAYPMSDKTMQTFLTSALADFAKEGGFSAPSGDVLASVAPILSRAWDEHIGNVQQRTAIVLLRIINGAIQFATVVFGALCVIILLCRWLICRRSWERPAGKAGLSEIPPGGADAMIKEALGKSGDFVNAWGRMAPSLNILDGFEKGRVKDRSSGREIAESLAQVELERLQYRSSFYRFLSSGMPAIGFLGTVWGIGFALGAVGKILTPEVAQQQSGIADIALRLSVAFDTTLVALFLSLLVNCFESLVCNAEERSIVDAKELCIRASI